ncbi:MAG: hypothetical protein D6725_17280 [Planctomycetota bacterium]|nr:MAG: hypothetical protein D6725_17280 [Planctomycetota bacterium]
MCDGGHHPVRTDTQVVVTTGSSSCHASPEQPPSQVWRERPHVGAAYAPVPDRVVPAACTAAVQNRASRYGSCVTERKPPVRPVPRPRWLERANLCVRVGARPRRRSVGEPSGGGDPRRDGSALLSDERVVLEFAA